MTEKEKKERTVIHLYIKDVYKRQPQNSTMPEKSNIYWLAVITGEIVITNRKK